MTGIDTASKVGEELENAVSAAQGEPGLLDFAAVVLLVFLVLCVFSYLARRSAPAESDTFAFYSQEAGK